MNSFVKIVVIRYTVNSLDKSSNQKNLAKDIK